jgi:putative membrane protein
MNAFQTRSLLALDIFILATWINPRWPVEQALHTSLTIAGLVYLVIHSKRWPLNNFDFTLILLFIAIHSIAARWLYSFVPYDEWLQTALNWSPNETFGWDRNHFDRFVHLLYGLCFTGAIGSDLQKRKQLTPHFALFVAVLLIAASSVLYEWLEWLIAVLLSPEAAEAYNGQQGDMWDAHKDMLLASLGSLAWYFAPRFRNAQRTTA